MYEIHIRSISYATCAFAAFMYMYFQVTKERPVSNTPKLHVGQK